MTWAKLDDRFHENRKIKRVWKRCPIALGLHVMAITYCAGHATDGFVDVEFVEEKLPVKRDRERATAALVDTGLWHADTDGWSIHDFLEFNPSRAQRESEHQIRSEAGRKGADARWNGKQTGSTRHSNGHSASDDSRLAGANGIAMAADAPVPTRTRKTPKPPEGASSGEAKNSASSPVQRAQQNGFDEWLLDHATVTGDKPPKSSTKAYTHLAEMFNGRIGDGRTLSDLKLATRGAFNDEFRRANGHYGAESVLRPLKNLELVNKGRRLDSQQNAPGYIEQFRSSQQRLRERYEREERGA